MYSLNVSKDSLSYCVCIRSNGLPLEDFVRFDEEAAKYLASLGPKILKGEDDYNSPVGKVYIDKSPNHGNAYKLVVSVAEHYVRVFILTEPELKLFVASLKRALDG